MTTTLKSRDYVFDNYKALLIILVIIGHFIQPCYENNTLLYTTKYFIYAFHMPAFIFISGYFSKKQISARKAIKKFLMPYVAFETIYYLYYNYVIGISCDFEIAFPKFSLWYLLALFVWKIATPYVKKIPHYFLGSVLAGLAIGLLPTGGTFLSIARIFAFFPYFLAGTMLDRAALSEMHNKKSYKFLSIAGISAFVIYLVTFTEVSGLRLNYFYGKTSYVKMGQTALEGICVRLFCYGIGFFLTYAIALLMTEKETSFSRLGIATMPIYLFHGLYYKFWEHCTTILEDIYSVHASLGLLFFCVVLAFVFSWEPLVKFVNLFSNISLTAIGEYAQKTSSYYHGKEKEAT